MRNRRSLATAMEHLLAVEMVLLTKRRLAGARAEQEKEEEVGGRRDHSKLGFKLPRAICPCGRNLAFERKRGKG